MENSNTEKKFNKNGTEKSQAQLAYEALHGETPDNVIEYVESSRIASLQFMLDLISNAQKLDIDFKFVSASIEGCGEFLMEKGEGLKLASIVCGGNKQLTEFTYQKAIDGLKQEIEKAKKNTTKN